MEASAFFHTRGWDRAGPVWPLRVAGVGGQVLLKYVVPHMAAGAGLPL